MNRNGTMSTALWRGLLVALGSGVAAAVPVFLASDDWKLIVATFVTAFLAALGIRGGVEGKVDAARQLAGDVRPGDVQAGTSGKP